MTSVNVNLTIDTQFLHSTWIRAGKEFSRHLPLVVYDKKQEILKIPHCFLAQLPIPVTLVYEFINHSFPLQSSNLSFHQLSRWFSTEVPLTYPGVLLTRPIPPAKVLKDLDTAIGQVWFDGASSIVDLQFNNGTERFPLWVLSLWQEMEKMVENQRWWKSSIHQLELKTHPQGITVQAKNLIEKLSWNGPLSGGVSTLEFAGFLGVSWLSDTQINMMVDVLQNQMKTQEYAEGTLLESLALS